MGLADGPTEVHKVTLARELLKDVKPPPACSRRSTFRQRAAAEAKYADKLAGIPGGGGEKQRGARNDRTV